MAIDLIVTPGGIVVVARDRNDWTAEHMVTWHDLEHAVINIMRPAIDRVIDEIDGSQKHNSHCADYGA
jgi:hypothetical protein